jgi:hypothetical protein
MADCVGPLHRNGLFRHRLRQTDFKRNTSMNAMLKSALAMAGLAVAAQATAQVTFYEREGFAGRSFSAEGQVGDFERYGFDDRTSSVEVLSDRWEVCEGARFSGRCVVLRPGRYPSLASMGLNDRVSSARVVSSDEHVDDGRYAPVPLGAQIIFYEREGFAGQSFTTETQVGNFVQSGYNDRASSVIVLGDRFEVCEDARFSGRCVVLRPGRYPSLAAMGLNDRISSVRAVSRDDRIDEDRYAPAPVPVYDSRRRGNERLYEANVTSVHAVVGTPEQRCWVQSEQVAQERGGALGGQALRDREGEAAVEAHPVGEAAVMAHAGGDVLRAEVLVARPARLAGEARPALPADAHPGADLQLADLGAGGGHRPDDLVARDHGVGPHAPVAVHQVDVAVADAAVADPDLDVVGPQGSGLVHERLERALLRVGGVGVEAHPANLPSPRPRRSGAQ